MEPPTSRRPRRKTADGNLRMLSLVCTGYAYSSFFKALVDDPAQHLVVAGTDPGRTFGIGVSLSGYLQRSRSHVNGQISEAI